MPTSATTLAAPRAAPTDPEEGPRQTWAADLRASLVVFLVALPLCLGVAVASGVPAELGLVTGIVGGIVVGLMPGSTWQVSGPAAGLTVLVFGLVERHGLAVLGPVVVLAGLLQLALAAVRLGDWFRAMALPVVHGMLGGIGLLIIVGQVLVLAGDASSGDGLEDLVAAPGALAGAAAGVEGALVAGLIALAILVGWRKAPERLRAVPGPLVAVVAGTAAAVLLGLDARQIDLPASFADAVDPPSPETFLDALTDPAILGLALALGLVASAESLLSAVAVDRMHGGRPTRFNAELGAQGLGNTIAGLLGALPMTAVIVRSAANVEAGARTRSSRVLHGVWLLLFAAAIPGVLNLIPTATLAAVLIMAGVALLKPATVRRMHREGRGELAIYLATIAGVFVLGLLEGVLLGLALSAVALLLRLGRLEIASEGAGDDARDVVLRGPATFLTVPKLASALEAQPAGADVRLDLTRAGHVDPAAQDLVDGWTERHERTGGTVEVIRNPAPGPDR